MSVTPTDTPDETADWKVYQNKDLGIEFKYPLEWGEIVFSSKAGGDSGEKFGGYFTNKELITFGGITKDFAEGRGAGFLDFAGFTDQGNNIYQYQFALNKYNKITPFKKISLEDGSIAIIIANQEIPMAFSSESRGAYINLKSSKFGGIAFQYIRTPKDQEAVFDKMISSIKFIK